jgi:hypothetical protein
LVFTLHFEGYLPRRQKPAKYIKMIQGLADAVESQPFQMRSAAAYLRACVTETQQLAPPLDVSFIVSTPTVFPHQVGQSAAVVALEPSVTQVRVENGGIARGQPSPVGGMTPKMEIIIGMAQSFRNQGVGWAESYKQAYVMWGKLSVSLRQAFAGPPQISSRAATSNEVVADGEGGDEGGEPSLPPEDNLAEPLEIQDDF